MAVNEVRNRIYVGNGLDSTLTIIDGNTMRIVRTVGLPAPPIRIDADAAGQNVAVIGWAADPAVMIVSDPNVPPSALTITAVTQGAHGTVTVDANGMRRTRRSTASAARTATPTPKPTAKA